MKDDTEDVEPKDTPVALRLRAELKRTQVALEKCKKKGAELQTKPNPRLRGQLMAANEKNKRLTKLVQEQGETIDTLRSQIRWKDRRIAELEQPANEVVDMRTYTR